MLRAVARPLVNVVERWMPNALQPVEKLLRALFNL